jgi:hypothetical protein
MQVPIEFANACRNLHQDIGLFVNSPEDMVSAAIYDLTEQERSVIRTFLDKILTDNTNGATLKNVWRKTGTDINFPKAGDLLVFFRLMRSRLN